MVRSLENHVPERLWHKPIAAIEAPEVLDFMIALQAKVPETASRVRQRLETIFDDALLQIQRQGSPRSWSPVSALPDAGSVRACPKRHQKRERLRDNRRYPHVGWDLSDAAIT